MHVKVLQIFLGSVPVGKLFQYANGTSLPVTRFVADEDFIARCRTAPMLSLSMLADDPEQQASFWHDVTRNPAFNGPGDRLPAYFQNLLPEGVLRRHVAEHSGYREADHFGILAATGLDLPGAVRAMPIKNMSPDALQRLVGHDQDTLEMSVVAEPLPEGVSITGMQPKLGLVLDPSGRYVARPQSGSSLIIGKLPRVDRALLPELEYLSLQLAEAAGIKVCTAELVSLEKLHFEHGFMIGGSSNFLAVQRFDRAEDRRIHAEDFAQVLGVDPKYKYRGATYAAMGAMMMRHPSLGEAAVHELLRQTTVNDIMGNYDAHLKNFCVIYPDGVHPELAPAFDIVAWSVYSPDRESALFLYRDPSVPRSTGQRPSHPLLTPYSLREFCARVGIAELPAKAVIRETATRARNMWPALIEAGHISQDMKDKLLQRLMEHPYITGLRSNAR